MHMYKKKNKPRYLKYILIFSVDIYQVVVLNIDGLVIVHCLCNG